jgi:serine/threonine protein phosphatase PrpC
MDTFLNRFKTKGLAFKLSLSILTGTFLLIFIILFYNYHVSKRLLLESAGETSEQLINATVSRIENVITSVQKAPEGIAIYLESRALKEETLEETHGVPLGINEHQVYQAGKIILEKKDCLILYTDGITEALSVDGDFYGDYRLMELISSRCKNSSPEQITRTIMEDVAELTRTPEKSDDITLMVLSYYPSDKM